MAGKSTILRSICAVALLSACGLHAPVQSALVPYTDAFMLRNFSADSPLEGKSSFAVEMVEMRSADDHFFWPDLYQGHAKSSYCVAAFAV